MNNIKKFRVLYEFSVPKIEKVEETIENADGSKTVKPVDKEVQHKFYIKKPSAAEYDEAELYYAKIYGESLNAGLITDALLKKRIIDDGGVFSKEEIRHRETLADQLKKEVDDYNLIKDKEEKLRTPDERETLIQLEKSIDNLFRGLQQYSDVESNVGISAESRSRNKTTIWWLLTLLYKEGAIEDVVEKVPVFVGRDSDEKIMAYNDIKDEEDPFLNRAINKAFLAICCWVATGIVTDEMLEKAANM